MPFYIECTDLGLPPNDFPYMTMSRSISRPIIIALIGLLLGTNAQGQTEATAVPYALSLDEARTQALEHNAQIQIAREEALGARYRQRAMRSLYLPRLSASAYALYTTSVNGTLQLGTLPLPAGLSQTLGTLAQAMPQLAPQLMPLAGGIPLPDLNYRLELDGNYYAGLSLTQPIYTGGKITSANRMADLARSMTEIATRRTEAEVILATDEAYWLLVQAEAMHTVATAYVETIAEAHRTVTNAVQAGMRTRADILRIEVEQSKAELQRARASNAIHLARMNLAQTIGLPLSTEISPSERLPELIPSEANAPLGDLSARPEYQLLEQQVALRAAEVKLTRSEFLPTLGIQASYAYTRGLELNDHLLLDRAAPAVVASLNIPILNWGEGRNKVRQARTQLRIAELERARLSERMLLEQQQADHAYREEALALTLASRTRAQALELLRQTRDRYDAGLETTATLLETQTLATQAESAYIVACTQLALARTRLQRVLGQLR